MCTVCAFNSCVLISTVMNTSADDSMFMTPTVVPTLVPISSLNIGYVSTGVSTTSTPNMYNTESTMPSSATISVPLLTTAPTTTSMAPSPPLSSTLMLWQCILIAVGTGLVVSLVLLVILLVCRGARKRMKFEHTTKLKPGVGRNQLEENQIEVLANPCSGSYISVDAEDDHQRTYTSTAPHSRRNVTPSAKLDIDSSVFKNEYFGTNDDFLSPITETSQRSAHNLSVGEKSTLQCIECSEQQHSQPEVTSQDVNALTSDLHLQEFPAFTSLLLTFEDGQDYPISKDPETYSTGDDEGAQPTIYSSQLLAAEDDKGRDMTGHEETEGPERNPPVDISVTIPGPHEDVVTQPSIYGVDTHVSENLRSIITSAAVEGLTSSAHVASGELPFATLAEERATYDIPIKLTVASSESTTFLIDPSTLYDCPNHKQHSSLDPGGRNVSNELQDPLTSGTTRIREKKDQDLQQNELEVLSPDISDYPRSDSSSSSLELEISHV